jgi:hypothetical protein
LNQTEATAPKCAKETLRHLSGHVDPESAFDPKAAPESKLLPLIKPIWRR